MSIYKDFGREREEIEPTLNSLMERARTRADENTSLALMEIQDVIKSIKERLKTYYETNEYKRFPW